jgi:hypothetical protein
VRRRSLQRSVRNICVDDLNMAFSGGNESISLFSDGGWPHMKVPVLCAALLKRGESGNTRDPCCMTLATHTLFKPFSTVDKWV